MTFAASCGAADKGASDARVHACGLASGCNIDSRLILPVVVLAPGAFRLVLSGAVIQSHISRLEIGRLAVLLFFFLSGYWVMRIWTEKFGLSDVRRFYASRYMRIAPLYLVAVTVAALALGQPLHIENAALLGVASSHRDPLAVSWSLDIELQFYLMFPLIVLLARTERTWLCVLLVSGLTVAGWYVSDRYGIVTLAQYLPAFALGAFTSARRWDPGRGGAYASLAAFIVVTALAALSESTSSFLDKTRPDPFDRDIFSLLWMAPLLPYVAHSLAQPSSRLDRRLGAISFPLYLVHGPILTLIDGRLGVHSAEKLLGVVLALGLSLVVYLVADRPLETLRKRLFEPSRPGPPIAAQA
jgi:peptidoglycan/LPS O-acetylase OafA/YrhL